MKAFVTIFVLAVLSLVASPVKAQSIYSLNAYLHSDLKAVVATTTHSVVLTWTQSTIPAGDTCSSGSGSTAVTSNAIYRATTSGAEGSTPYSVLTPAGTTFTDTAVTPGVTYFYTVTGSNCNGQSLQSNEVSALIPNPLAPNAPVQNAPVAQ